jgi:hypothetical protein
MKNKYPRFLFSHPKDTDGDGPFLIHTSYPKVLFGIEYENGSYGPEILEVWEAPFKNSEEAQGVLIPLLIEVQAWAKANNIKGFIK